MPRPVWTKYPEELLDEVCMISKVVDRSFSVTIIKLIELGIESLKVMPASELNDFKTKKRIGNDSIS